MNFNPDTHHYCAACRTTHRKPSERNGLGHAARQIRDSKIIAFYNENNTLAETGAKFNLSKFGISKILRAHGIEVRTYTTKVIT